MSQIALLSAEANQFVEEKQCTKCRRRRPLEAFSRRMLRGKSYVEARCRDCCNALMSEYGKKNRDHISQARAKWYSHNKDRLLAYEHGRYLRMHADRAAFVEWLKSAPCSDCDAVFPACCMDFDHVRGRKTFSIAQAVRGKFTNEEFMAELEKCELVCSNCHRIRTQSRRAARAAVLGT